MRYYQYDEVFPQLSAKKMYILLIVRMLDYVFISAQVPLLSFEKKKPRKPRTIFSATQLNELEVCLVKICVDLSDRPGPLARPKFKPPAIPWPKFAQNQPGFFITFFPKKYIIILENECF